MGTFKVPSASPPSTPPRSTRSSTRSPSTSPNAGQNGFQVPSSHGTPTTPGGRSSRGPSGSPQQRRQSVPGEYPASPFLPPNPPTTPSPQSANRNKRSLSPIPDSGDYVPSPRRRLLNFARPTAEQRQAEAHDNTMPVPPGERRRFNLRPARPRGQQRQEETDAFFNGGRESTPVAMGVRYHGSSGRSPSGSSSDEGDDGDDNREADDSEDRDHIEDPDDNTDPDPNEDPSNHEPPPANRAESEDLDDVELWMPMVAHQPERLPGRLSTAQAARRPLTLLRERPGRLPTNTNRSPTSPGFDWSDGAAWWYPAGSNGSADVARENFMPSGFKVITQGQADGAAEVMEHENLVRILDADGFAAEQVEVRQEVLYDYCSGGTLNKLMLSRRPEEPVYGNEGPVVRSKKDVDWLPTKVRELGLREDLVWHVLISLLRATYWLHDRPNPIVHGAIDPANVFFTAPKPDDERPLVRRYGLVKLSGFGKAVILPHRSDPDMTDPEEVEAWCQMFEHFVDEPYNETGYEAPELLGMLGEDEISKLDPIVPGPGSDVFSIGATCFAMMTGKTIWDVLLERPLEARGLPPYEVDRYGVEDTWREHPQEQRMDLLAPLLRGEAVWASSLPDWYSAELRQVIEDLLDLDPVMRGESVAMLEDAEEALAAKAVVSEPEAGGLRAMRMTWRAATWRPDERERLEMALREFEEGFGARHAAVIRRKNAGMLGPLEP